MNKIKLVTIIILLAVFTANTYATEWYEDFESYSAGTLPSPWETVDSQNVNTGIGYSSSKGCNGPTSNWVYGHAFKPSGGGNTLLTGKIYLSSSITYSAVMFGYTGEKTYHATAGYFTGSDSAYISVAGDDANAATITIISED